MSSLRKYLMFISYIGSTFRGSQIQLLKEARGEIPTVQGVLEKSVQNVLNLEGDRPVCVHLASRTDKGVHALRAAGYTSLPPYKGKFLEPEVLKKILDKYLLENSTNIRVLEVYGVPDSFLFSNLDIEKTYLYRIGMLREEFWNSFTDIPILEKDRADFIIRINKLFDFERAKKAVKLFEGKKDFGAVVGKPSKNNRPTVCNIKSFTIEEAQSFASFDTVSQRFNYYHLICKGDRFLYCMVRRMVSFALAVGFGTFNFEDIKKLFDEPLPSSWPNKTRIVSGCGLYLVNIYLNMEKYVQKDKYFFENSTVDNSKCNKKELL